MASSSSNVGGSEDLQHDDFDFLADFDEASKTYIMEMIDQQSKTIKLYFAGPEETPYEGGAFDVVVTFGANYPDSKAKIFFQTPIWNTLVDHQNFELICDQGQTMSISGAIDCIERTLRHVNPSKDSFCWKIPRFWTSEFAGKEMLEEDNILHQEVALLVEMGFDQMKALVALSTFNWEVELATEHLLLLQSTEDGAGPSTGGAGPSDDGAGPSNDGAGPSNATDNGDNADEEATEEEN